MEAWYVVNTKPHGELRVHQALSVRGFQAYLPMLPPRRDGRPQPLFPAYLFVRCELETVGINDLQWIPGLRRVVQFAGRPAVVPDEAISLIQAHLDQIDAQGGLPKHPFKPGDEVVIDGGPLSGLRGVFQGPVGPAERVQILIRFLGQANRAEVPVEVLRAVSEDEKERSQRRGTRGHGRRIHYHPEDQSGPNNGQVPPGES
jgi:transcriptional antiterminator RfaH